MNIPDDMVEQALSILNSGRHARARLAYEKKDREKKVILARLEREANEKTMRERETYALTHHHYAYFLEQLSLIEDEYFDARDQRDWAAAIIETWRTVQANNRSAERVR